MNTSPQVHAMIVAAGRGSRFGASIPKQYVKLDGLTLLQHSLKKLSQSRYVTQCLLVIAKDDDTAQTLNFALPVRYTIGAAERWQSVRAGMEAIIASGADESDLIVIHDAARPAVPSSDIDKVIEAAKFEPYGAILATPVADTLKKAKTEPSNSSPASKARTINSSPSCYIDHTIDRTNIWQAQTPQVFRLAHLKAVLSHIEQHQLMITDEASAFEYLNLPIQLVEGSRLNIKLTYPDDMLLLTAIVNAQ